MVYREKLLRYTVHTALTGDESTVYADTRACFKCLFLMCVAVPLTGLPMHLTAIRPST